MSVKSQRGLTDHIIGQKSRITERINRQKQILIKKNTLPAIDWHVAHAWKKEWRPPFIPHPVQ